MFDYQGPVWAANQMAEFREDFSDKLPEAQNTKLRELNREISPVPKLLGGMEVLYVVAIEATPSTVAARKALWQTLGEVARAAGENAFGGAETRDRAWLIMAWAAHQLDPTGDAPTQPEVDKNYTTVAPVIDPNGPMPPVPNPTPEA